MTAFLSWYLAITLTGFVAIPVGYKLFPNLADRGYALARPLGLLIWGFVFWFLTSFQILQNNSGGVLLAFLLLAGVSIAISSQIAAEILAFYRTRIKTILIGEILFLAAFAGLAILRAANPDIVGTEKPMELAFINGILRSPVFPPMDIWLSGYAISYYYFGYILVALLIKVTGVPASVSFNLAIALWFGLTALAAYGITYSLLFHKKINLDGTKTDNSLLASLGSLLAPLFILLVSNIEGFLEMLHARGLFWIQSADGSWQSAFWKWLGIQELDQAPALPYSWIPTRAGGIWWWRASRVLQDFDLTHQPREIIDEFPFFSYLLADLHPHVLAMPFVLLAVGLALNLYYQPRKTFGRIYLIQRFVNWTNGIRSESGDLFIVSWLRRVDFWAAALILGGLAFINTWDFPIYVALFCSAFSLSRYQEEGWKGSRILEFIELGVAIGCAGLLHYLPFYIGFSSQAGGILPSLEFFTRGVQFWTMFFPLLLPIIAWLFWMWKKKGSRVLFRRGVIFSASMLFGLWAFSFFLGELILNAQVLVGLLPVNLVDPGLVSKVMDWEGLFNNLHGGVSGSALMTGALIQRFVSPGAWITLLLLLAGVWGLLSRRDPISSTEGDKKMPETELENEPEKIQKPHAFVLLLVMVGIGLALIPEFVYLRDQFGWRMNTIFKFYYQTWILWSLAAGYASAVLWSVLKSSWKHVFRLGWTTVIFVSLAYTIFGVWAKMSELKPSEWNLDGTAYIERYNPNEMAGIRWMQNAPLGVEAEAVGGSYTNFARIATHSGQPTVLGWPGHESQWRGGGREIGSRQADIERLYKTTAWDDALAIIRLYNIRYVYVGSLERSSYRVSEAKFQKNLKTVFQQGEVVIYEFPDFNYGETNGFK